ncbi:hypothetical protein [Lutibaculum baratangense]|nr:hypothetical protein [Lutibaculum baratangense]
MRKQILATMLALAMTPAAFAQDAGEVEVEEEGFFERAGRALDGAAEATGEAVRDAARDASEYLGDAAERAGDAAEDAGDAAQDAGEDLNEEERIEEPTPPDQTTEGRT